MTDDQFASEESSAQSESLDCSAPKAEYVCSLSLLLKLRVLIRTKDELRQYSNI